MSEYRAVIEWNRGGARFTDNRYSRGHRWRFDGGIDVPASASPHVVPLPMSVAAAVDPEEAFVASLSSCHMLFFLSLAAKRGYVVDDYRDEAVGTMARDSGGKFAMTQVTLHPSRALRRRKAAHARGGRRAAPRRARGMLHCQFGQDGGDLRAGTLAGLECPHRDRRSSLMRSTSWFTRIAKKTAQLSGRPATFALAGGIVVAWGISGPLFGFSDTWQLVINTGTTIVTFLMVFLIQNTQNRDTAAIQIKLDELIRVTRGHNALMDLEELEDKDLETFRRKYEKLAAAARRKIDKGGVDIDSPEPG